MKTEVRNQWQGFDDKPEERSRRRDERKIDQE
jgi:hypothetical protein